MASSSAEIVCDFFPEYVRVPENAPKEVEDRIVELSKEFAEWLRKVALSKTYCEFLGLMDGSPAPSSEVCHGRMVELGEVPGSAAAFRSLHGALVACGAKRVVVVGLHALGTVLRAAARLLPGSYGVALVMPGFDGAPPWFARDADAVVPNRVPSAEDLLALLAPGDAVALGCSSPAAGAAVGGLAARGHPVVAAGLVEPWLGDDWLPRCDTRSQTYHDRDFVSDHVLRFLRRAFWHYEPLHAPPVVAACPAASLGLVALAPAAGPPERGAVGGVQTAARGSGGRKRAYLRAELSAEASRDIRAKCDRLGLDAEALLGARRYGFWPVCRYVARSSPFAFSTAAPVTFPAVEEEAARLAALVSVVEASLASLLDRLIEQAGDAPPAQ